MKFIPLILKHVPLIDQYQQHIEFQEARIDGLIRDIKSLRQQLRGVNRNNAEMKSEIKGMEGVINVLRAEVQKRNNAYHDGYKQGKVDAQADKIEAEHTC